MSRIAIHIWRDRVAPVFDSGGLIRVWDGQEHADRVVRCPQPALRAEELADMGVEILICGAISRCMHDAVTARGVFVVGFVTGETDRVIAAWQEGVLDERFVMPGCRGSEFGRGRGHVVEHGEERKSGAPSCRTERARNTGLPTRGGARNRRGICGARTLGPKIVIDQDENGNITDK